MQVKRLYRLIYEGEKEGLTEDQVLKGLEKQGILTPKEVEEFKRKKELRKEKILNYDEIKKAYDEKTPVIYIAKKWGVSPNYISQLMRKNREEIDVDEKGNFIKKEWNKDKQKATKWLNISTDAFWQIKNYARLTGKSELEIVNMVLKYVEEKGLENKILYKE